jgi:hypothetical protein
MQTNKNNNFSRNSGSEKHFKFHLFFLKTCGQIRMISIPKARYFFRKYTPSRSSNFSSETRPDKKLWSCWSDLSYGGSAMQNICVYRKNLYHVTNLVAHVICLQTFIKVQNNFFVQGFMGKNTTLTLRVL